MSVLVSMLKACAAAVWQMEFLVLVLLTRTVISSTTSTAGLVKPRRFTVIAEPGGGDWYRARAACASLNMTLATVDPHAFDFLLAQSTQRSFQRHVTEDLWIGLYDVNAQNRYTKSAGNFRWESDCEVMSAGSELWAEGQPRVDTGDDHCVYADNATLRWRTDRCRARHQYLCQAEQEACQYRRTVPTCTLYIRASKRNSLFRGTPLECARDCEKTPVDSLPCWGFTMTTSGCVLHYQVRQPRCAVIHYTTTAFFRTCFHISYVEGPISTLSADATVPLVPECNHTQDRLQRALSSGGHVASPDPTDTTTAMPTSLSEDGTQPATQRTTAQRTQTTLVPTPSNSSNLLLAQVTNVTLPFPRPVTSTPTTSSVRSRAMCSCRCGVLPRMNRSEMLKAAEVTKQELSLDVTKLSATRRKKKSASDERVSSCGIATVGLVFVATTLLCVVVLDLVTVVHHLTHGVPRTTRPSARRQACHLQ